ncbi:hypothetical protein [Nostoc sp.]
MADGKLPDTNRPCGMVLGSGNSSGIAFRTPCFIVRYIRFSDGQSWFSRP